MGKYQTFEQFLTTQSPGIPLVGLIINLLLAALLSFILGRIYVRYGDSLSNRKIFAKNFILIAMTTMLIIVIVKSSLALSLGLVGALSIVRFRSAIKEPEELSYLFLNIAIGLGLGADQTFITLIAFVIIITIIIIKNRREKYEENQNLHLTVTSHNPHKTSLEEVVKTLKKNCSAVEMKRFDEAKEVLEVSFLVEFDTFEQFKATKDELKQLDDSIKITFMDNKGLI
ncbi:MAG: DUF4956 domain-containing protein [Sedimentisphaerales bacterium]|nr:DUF4956 domain-containing protein [Sedimentisphaerales bacterium]